MGEVVGATRRIQLVTRPWGGSTEVEPSGGTMPPGLALHVVHGVVEGGADLLHDEMRGLALMPGDRLATLDERGGRPVDEWQDGTDEADEVTSALRLAVWRLPAAPVRGAMVGLVLLRPCALEAAPGLGAALVCGILGSAPGAFPASLSLDGEGRGGAYRLGPSAVPRPEPPRGAAPAHAYKEPLWGWGPEPVAFRSTMGLAAQDALDAAYAMPPKGQRTEAEEARWRELQRACGGTCARDGDDRFSEFLDRMAREPGWVRTPTRVPRTALEIAAEDAIVERVLEGMLDG